MSKKLKQKLMYTGCSKFETKVLIIGNGPAGIALSAFLSGMHPYYNPNHPHENPTVHEKLLEFQDFSLLDQDLSWSSNLSEISQSGRPISVLYDMLVRPGADVGRVGKSCLQWDYNRAREVPNMVISDTKIGGSWNKYDPNMLTVSFSDWLDMPGFSVEQWLGGKSLIKRLPSAVIAKYLKKYVEKLRLKKRFYSNFKVTSIKKVNDYWITEGISTTTNRLFMIKSNAIVIASGKTSPKKLEVPGEEKFEQRIVYDAKTLKDRIELQENKFIIDEEIPSTSESLPVVVVGDGISSVDCVRNCLEKGCEVIHVIRRNAKQLRNVMMSRLSPTHYSEYTNIYRLMIGRETNKKYRRILDGKVTRIDEKCVEICKGEMEERLEINYSTIAVCIGRESHFDQVFDGFKPTFLDYQSIEHDHLFAIGAYAGDHFVRFLIGGCLRVAQKILSSPKICAHGLNNNGQEGEIKC